MIVLVLGGNGFIGGNFIKYILKENPDWKVINYSRSEKVRESDYLRNIVDNPNYSFVKGDLKNKDLIKELASSVDYIVNFIGKSNIREFIEKPAESINDSLAGVISLLGAARASNLKKVVIMTSWEVYGDKKGSIAYETDILNPENIYASMNAAIETISKGYYKSYGVPVISIRSCNVFGPGQATDKIISGIIVNLLDGKKVVLFGDGKDIRSYVYVDDLCRAIIFLLKKGKEGEVYNVGSGELISNLDLAKKIIKKMGKTEESIEFLPEKKTENRNIILNLEKIKGLGWRPEIDFERGIKKTIEWYSKK